MNNAFIKVDAIVFCGYPSGQAAATVKTIEDVRYDRTEFESGVGVLIDGNWLDSFWVHPLIKDSVEAIDIYTSRTSQE